MKVAMGMNTVSDRDLTFARQIGVTRLITRPEYRLEDGGYSFESLVQLRTRVEAAGLRVAALHDVPPEWNDRIRRGEPGRDEQIGRRAVVQTNLLESVVQHKSLFFHSGWANYQTAVPGSIRLLPKTGRIGELKRDYEAMAEMLITEPQPLNAILRVIGELEERINVPGVHLVPHL